MHLVNFSNLSKESVEEIFDIADCLKNEPERYSQILNGKRFILFFPDGSIRTRVTFECGIQALGGVPILFPPAALDKKEALCDVLGYVHNWADAVIVRHSDHNKVLSMATQTDVPIINGMTSENHPCEILSDLYTFKERCECYSEKTYTFVGESGNISKTWVEAANVMGLKFNHVFYESERIKEKDDEHYLFSTTLDGIMEKSNIVLTDPIPESMRTPEYISRYQITLERMHQTPEGSLLNPCPPFYRGAEVSEQVIQSPYFVGYDFKKNLLVIQQAVLLYCLGFNVEELNAHD